ncbi:MAG TPA: hypothetical protein VEB22_10540 [Phycisphaerales bacterium]|nr:hypothetical protein [Phycisphaerales bacterium]
MIPYSAYHAGTPTPAVKPAPEPGAKALKPEPRKVANRKKGAASRRKAAA